MSNKPIFVATHPRACSTAFERVFMTRTDILKCVHEPFGDAFYFGPERLSERYESDQPGRIESGFSQSTFKTILERLDREASEGKRLFIKDIAHYLVPPEAKPASIAPSLATPKKGVGTESNGSSNDADSKAPYPYATDAEKGNPTVVPTEILKGLHFTFLIRHPRSSIPSYYRCTVPPLDEVTGFYNFMPSEAGYDELRRIFDYLREEGHIGPAIAGRAAPEQVHSNGGLQDGVDGHHKPVEICVVDADDLLDNPEGIIRAYCKSVGIPFKKEMLTWDSPEQHQAAKDAFEKWNGFHNDAIESKALKARDKKPKTEKDEDQEWTTKYGSDGAKVIRDTVQKNLDDYHYLKQFALQPSVEDAVDEGN